MLLGSRPPDRQAVRLPAEADADAHVPASPKSSGRAERLRHVHSKSAPQDGPGPRTIPVVWLEPVMAGGCIPPLQPGTGPPHSPAEARGPECQPVSSAAE